MYGLQTFCPDIVGLKRHLFTTQQHLSYENLQKRTKLEESIKLKLEASEPMKTPLLPEIPPLSLSKVTTNTNNIDSLQPLLLLNRANLLQQYFQLLTLSQYAKQQRELLTLKRDNSASSCASYTTCASLSPMKVPVILAKPESPVTPIKIPEIQIPKLLIDSSPSKKCSKVSACKNYIALLCTGFARSILTADPNSEIMDRLQQVISLKKAKYIPSEPKDGKELQALIVDHIYKDICGKKVKKMNKGRDFKVRNTEELEGLLIVKEGDTDFVKFRKEVLREMLDYFFMSRCYLEWLEKGMINDANKSFFLKNKVEIQKKFNNPILYKPHFEYN